MIIESLIGVLTGTLGTALTSFLSFKAQKEKNKHEQVMVKLQTDAMIAEANANIRVTEANVAGELEKMDSEIYKASVELGNKVALDDKVLMKLFESKWTYVFGVILALLLGIVDFVKHALRPALTAYLMVIASIVTWQSWEILSASGYTIPMQEAIDMYKTNITTVWYLAVSFSTWWFGDRRVAKYLYRLNDGNMREQQ
jgi:hypothetical protein